MAPRAPLRTARFAAHTLSTLLRFEVHRRLVADGRHDALVDAYRRRTARRVLSILGVRLGVEGEVPAPARARLVVANHRTALDIGVLMSLVGGTFLSRSDLAGWPIVGRLARYADTIFVDRQSGTSGARAIRDIRRQLKVGRTVIVFPEGTTYPGDEVRPFRPGAFAAAKGLDAEVLPIGLAYPPGIEYVDMSFGEHLGRVASRRDTFVCVQVGGIIPVSGQATTLAAAAEASVRDLVAAARRRAPATTE